MSNSKTAATRAVQDWRAREAAAFALGPILQREGVDTIGPGELSNAAIDTYLRVVSEPLPEAWRKYVIEQ